MHIFAQEGTRGLYKGFTVAAMGNIPIQISSMTTYEVSSPFGTELDRRDLVRCFTVT